MHLKAKAHGFYGAIIIIIYTTITTITLISPQGLYCEPIQTTHRDPPGAGESTTTQQNSFQHERKARETLRGINPLDHHQAPGTVHPRLRGGGRHSFGPRTHYYYQPRPRPVAGRNPSFQSQHLDPKMSHSKHVVGTAGRKPVVVGSSSNAPRFEQRRRIVSSFTDTVSGGQRCSRGHVKAYRNGRFYTEDWHRDTTVGYQADSLDSAQPTGGPIKISGQLVGSPAVSWKRLEPVVECGDDAMFLTVRKRRAAQLRLDRGNSSALPLSELSSDCGYSVNTTWKDLLLVAPYNACHIALKDDAYVLPLLWRGTHAVKVACPVPQSHVPPALEPSSLCCSPRDMTVTLQGPAADHQLRVKVRGEWTPLVSLAQQCGYTLIKHAGVLQMNAPFLACGVAVKDGNYTLYLQIGEKAVTLACPISPPEQLFQTRQPATDAIHYPTRGPTEPAFETQRPISWGPPFYLAPLFYPYPTDPHYDPHYDHYDDGIRPSTPTPTVHSPSPLPSGPGPEESQPFHQYYYPYHAVPGELYEEEELAVSSSPVSPPGGSEDSNGPPHADGARDDEAATPDMSHLESHLHHHGGSHSPSPAAEFPGGHDARPPSVQPSGYTFDQYYHYYHHPKTPPPPPPDPSVQPSGYTFDHYYHHPKTPPPPPPDPRQGPDPGNEAVYYYERHPEDEQPASSFPPEAPSGSTPLMGTDPSPETSSPPPPQPYPHQYVYHHDLYQTELERSRHADHVTVAATSSPVDPPTVEPIVNARTLPIWPRPRTYDEFPSYVAPQPNSDRPSDDPEMREWSTEHVDQSRHGAFSQEATPEHPGTPRPKHAPALFLSVEEIVEKEGDDTERNPYPFPYYFHPSYYHYYYNMYHGPESLPNPPTEASPALFPQAASAVETTLTPGEPQLKRTTPALALSMEESVEKERDDKGRNPTPVLSASRPPLPPSDHRYDPLPSAIHPPLPPSDHRYDPLPSASHPPLPPSDHRYDPLPSASHPPLPPSDHRYDPLPSASHPPLPPSDHRYDSLPSASHPPLPPSDHRYDPLPSASHPPLPPSDHRYNPLPSASHPPLPPSDHRYDPLPSASHPPLPPSDHRYDPLPSASRPPLPPSDHRYDSLPSASHPPLPPSDHRYDPLPSASRPPLPPSDHRYDPLPKPPQGDGPQSPNPDHYPFPYYFHPSYYYHYYPVYHHGPESLHTPPPSNPPAQGSVEPTRLPFYYPNKDMALMAVPAAGDRGDGNEPQIKDMAVPAAGDHGDGNEPQIKDMAVPAARDGGDGNEPQIQTPNAESTSDDPNIPLQQQQHPYYYYYRHPYYYYNYYQPDVSPNDHQEPHPAADGGHSAKDAIAEEVSSQVSSQVSSEVSSDPALYATTGSPVQSVEEEKGSPSMHQPQSKPFRNNPSVHRILPPPPDWLHRDGEGTRENAGSTSDDPNIPPQQQQHPYYYYYRHPYYYYNYYQPDVSPNDHREPHPAADGGHSAKDAIADEVSSQVSSDPDGEGTRKKSDAHVSSRDVFKASAFVPTASPCGHGPDCSNSTSYAVEDCTVGQHLVFVVPDSVTELTVARDPDHVLPDDHTSGQVLHDDDDDDGSCTPHRLTSDPQLYTVPLEGCGIHTHVAGQTVVYLLEVQGIVSLKQEDHSTVHQGSPVRLMVECRSSPGSPGNVRFQVVCPSPPSPPSIQTTPPSILTTPPAPIQTTPPPPPIQTTSAAMSVQLRLATDESYSGYHPDAHLPLSRVRGRAVHMEVVLLNPPEPQLLLLVHYCLAYTYTPYPKWMLLYEGCPRHDDSSQTALPEATHLNNHTFRLAVGRFPSLPTRSPSYLDTAKHSHLGEDPEIYVWCSTEVCSGDDPRCSVGCIQWAQ